VGLSGTTSAGSATIAQAIIGAFEAATARKADALPSSSMLKRAEIGRHSDSHPTRPAGELVPIHRALLVAQDELDALLAATDAADLDATANIRPDALVRVLLTPSPSPAAHAIKLRLYEEHHCWALVAVDEIARVLVSDARRHARTGAYPQADAAVLSAFAAYRDDLAEFDALPGMASRSEEDALYLRVVVATEAVLAASAQTVEGILAKLRHGFQAIGKSRLIQDAVLAPTSLRFREELAMEDVNERILWGAVTNLARIAGVDLTEKAS
jgi:hypothetical protein